MPGLAFQAFQYLYGSSFLTLRLLFLLYFLTFTLFGFFPFCCLPEFKKWDIVAPSTHSSMHINVNYFFRVWNILPNLEPDFRPLKLLPCYLQIFPSSPESSPWIMEEAFWRSLGASFLPLQNLMSVSPLNTMLLGMIESLLPTEKEH